MPSKTPIVIRVPLRASEARSPILICRGKKKLGELSSRPQVKGNTLHCGKYILVLREWDGVSGNPESVSFDRSDPKFQLMKVAYQDDWAEYRLYDEKVVYSDGPPHPDHLQLAVRIARTDGVEDPPTEKEDEVQGEAADTEV